MDSHIFQQFIGATLLVIVLLLIIFRPRNLNVSWPAGVGAVICILLQLIPFPELQVIFNDTWNASLTLIALFILSDALESNRFFDWAAAHIAIWAKSSGMRLYFYILILTTFTTALLANDGAILILTPILATLLLKIYPNKVHIYLPFIFAVGFFADATSISLLPSNLTNIIIADANRLNFGSFALHMLLPTLFTFIAAGIAFGLRFRKELATPYSLKSIRDPKKVIKDTFTFYAGWIALVVLIIGYIIAGQFHLPVTVIALPISLIMLAIVHLRKLKTATDIMKHAPWNILVYALGMFVVITAAYNIGLFAFFLTPLKILMISSNPLNVFLGGSIFGGVSAIFNNLPATLLGVLSLRGIEHLNEFSIYTLLLGVNIGPKLTPFGSLSTLLWLGILAKNNIHISWGTYIKENWWITIVTFIAAYVGLMLSRLLFGF